MNMETVTTQLKNKFPILIYSQVNSLMFLEAKTWKSLRACVFSVFSLLLEYPLPFPPGN